MDDEKHALLRSLSTIGSARVNDKLDISGSKIEIHRPGIWSKFMRTFWNIQTVNDSIATVKSVLTDCFNYVDSFLEGRRVLDKKSSNFLQLLLEQMEECTKGLKNLTKTYEGESASDDMNLYQKNTKLKAADLRRYLEDQQVIARKGADPAEAKVMDGQKNGAQSLSGKRKPSPPPVPKRIKVFPRPIAFHGSGNMQHLLPAAEKRAAAFLRPPSGTSRPVPIPIRTPSVPVSSPQLSALSAAGEKLVDEVLDGAMHTEASDSYTEDFDDFELEEEFAHAPGYEDKQTDSDDLLNTSF